MKRRGFLAALFAAPVAAVAAKLGIAKAPAIVEAHSVILGVLKPRFYNGVDDFGVISIDNMPCNRRTVTELRRLSRERMLAYERQKWDELMFQALMKQ